VPILHKNPSQPQMQVIHEAGIQTRDNWIDTYYIHKSVQTSVNLALQYSEDLGFGRGKSSLLHVTATGIPCAVLHLQ
jgi:hypothetical protein